MSRKKTHDEFVKEVYNLTRDEYSILTEYKNAHEVIMFRHNCESCNNHEFPKIAHNFLQGQRCPKCSFKEKRKNRALSNEEFQKRLLDKYSGEFTTEDEYYNQSTVMTFVHTECGRSFPTTSKSLMLHGNCHICKNEELTLNKTKSHETFLNEIRELYDNEYEILTKYEKSDIYITVRHNSESCGNHEYPVLPYNLLNGYGCPKCAGNMLKTHEEFVNDVFNLVKNEYSVLGKYRNNKTYILMKHNNSDCRNHEYEVSPNDFLRGKRCPKCISSKGEKEISKFLKENKIHNESQYCFEDCRSILPLPFDFALFSENKLIVLIEYDGEQHYRPVTFGGITYEEAVGKLKLTQHRDSIKNEYCKQNNIPLLRIPYWGFNNIEQILTNELSKHFPELKELIST